MANKVFNMAGGKHSAAAYSAFENAMFGSCVASDSDFVASAGTGMNVSLTAGNGLIDTGLNYARRIQSDATQTIAVSAASSANPRKDAIVAYIDNSVTPSTSYTDNTNNILKFKSVDGTPAANPSAPSAATIQTSVGAGNPYVVLWHVLVPKSATSLSAATFTRACRVANAYLPNNSVELSNLASNIVSMLAYAPGDVATLKNQKLCILISDSGGSQDYFVPLPKSLARVTGATVKITSTEGYNFFRTIDATVYGFGRPTEDTNYTGTICENGVKFTASLKAGTSNGNIQQNQTGVATIGEMTITFS